jgi:alanyl-tRNA synthetase
MKSLQLRKKYLDFFAKNGHTIVPSSSLIPAQDPTLLFANAGMNQFKDIFLGKEKRSYTRATSSQKCVRAGGKHNDLENVGFTARHLTFFEMLGNFSFGDYFKKEAISFAWELLTKEMGLPADKLYATVFTTDDQAFEIWNKVVGLPENRIKRLGEKDNFWQMGDTGPCGPCTEIYIDKGAGYGCGKDDCAPGCDCDRFMEIWNLVFMQYNRQADGELKPLTKTGVDTGMGLERLCCVVQGKDSVFETDLFADIIDEIEKITGINYNQSPEKIKAAFRVLCDHVRSSSFLIADGCSPSNDGRGYVLRKIIRRAAMFAQKLSDDKKLLSKLSSRFIKQMSPVYAELAASEKIIANTLDSEVEKFALNLIQGQNIFTKYIEDNKKDGQAYLSGYQIFKLYDTYGFPPELTKVLAQENNFTLDMAEFEKEMEKQREQSGKKQDSESRNINIPAGMSTDFVGYTELESKSKIIFVHDNQDQTVWIVTDKSPFYAESGGQSADKGWITIEKHALPVLDLQKLGDVNSPAIAAKISLKTESGTVISDLKIGDEAVCMVDYYARINTVKNHTATHLLQAALVQILGTGIKQAGSSVCTESFRFDFLHPQALTDAQIKAVEDLVNQKIQEDIATKIFHTTLEEAKNAGAAAFFGEKYNPEKVRVVQIPGFSAELCGGTHASSTGIIGCFKIISETALSTGTRRITGVTGPEAIKLFQQTFTTVKKLGEDFKVKFEDAYNAVCKLQEHYQEAQSEIKQLRKQLIKTQIVEWQNKIVVVGKIPFIYLEIEDLPAQEMKSICIDLEKHKPGLYFIFNKAKETDSSSDSGNFAFMAYQSKKSEHKVSLKALSELLKSKFNIRGGGSEEMIQGGGQGKPQNLEQEIIAWIKSN